jgi:glycerol-3-phosphate acyltransferase PlsY
MLDISKAAIPVGLSYYNLGIRGIPMYLIAIAPILGHVFSPFLQFHGGKAIAASLGVWIGLTIWKASLVGVVGTILGIAVSLASKKKQDLFVVSAFSLALFLYLALDT